MFMLNLTLSKYCLQSEVCHLRYFLYQNTRMETIEDLTNRIGRNKLKDLLRQRDSIDLTNSSQVAAIESAVSDITTAFIHCIRLYKELDSTKDTTDRTALETVAFESCRLLRNSCAVGQTIQMFIINLQNDSENVLQAITMILSKTLDLEAKTQKMAWQLLANLGVQNETTQQIIWNDCIKGLLTKFKCVCEIEHSGEFTMILYNLFLAEFMNVDDQRRIAEFMMECLSSTSEHDLQQNEFHQIFMEHLITQCANIEDIYEKFTSSAERLRLLYYINDHVGRENHQPISNSLLKLLVRELKAKSSNILNVDAFLESPVDPKEAFELIDVFGQISNHMDYRLKLAEDMDVYMCIGCLLKAMNEIHKKAMASGEISVFSPVQRLEALSLESRNSINQDILFQLKTKLMRILTNLTYRNQRNQNLAREMGFLTTVLDSTVLDAKNPLLKEWSVLCIRNLCERNEENQRIIGNMNKISNVRNVNGTSDTDLDTGVLRISSKKRIPEEREE